MFALAHTPRTIHSLAQKEAAHKKTRTRTGDEGREKKMTTHNKKNTYDLKGKHFSCYPFLTSCRYWSQQPHRTKAVYNTAPICLRIRKKVGVFFLRCSFLASFEACCVWMMMIELRPSCAHREPFLRTQIYIRAKKKERENDVCSIEIKCLCCCS